MVDGAIWRAGCGRAVDLGGLGVACWGLMGR